MRGRGAEKIESGSCLETLTDYECSCSAHKLARSRSLLSRWLALVDIMTNAWLKGIAGIRAAAHLPTVIEPKLRPVTSARLKKMRARIALKKNRVLTEEDLVETNQEPTYYIYYGEFHPIYYGFTTAWEEEMYEEMYERWEMVQEEEERLKRALESEEEEPCWCRIPKPDENHKKPIMALPFGKLVAYKGQKAVVICGGTKPQWNVKIALIGGSTVLVHIDELELDVLED